MSTRLQAMSLIVLVFCSACALMAAPVPPTPVPSDTPAPTSTPLPPTQPPASPTPDPREPLTIDGVKLQISMVSLDGNLGNGMSGAPAGAIATTKPIAIGIKILDESAPAVFETEKKVGGWEVFLTDETGEKFTNRVAFASSGANPNYNVVWIISAPVDPESLVLHFPSGEEISLEAWME